jgi:uncharacterized SAM-binding protein YcdF (DUF218 family)
MAGEKKSWSMKRALLCLALICLSWLICLAISIVIFARDDASTNADCIIVLGAAVYGSKPSPVFEERLRHAIALYHAGRSKNIIFTGGFGEGASHAESDVGKSYGSVHGVPSNSMLTENRSKTTQQNLLEAHRLMLLHHWQTALVVSDPLHLKRATMIGRDLGFEAIPSPTPTSRYRSLKSKVPFLLREMYFYHHYLFTGN